MIPIGTFNKLKWPIPIGETNAPVWTESYFKYNSGKRSCVLEYGETESEWSDQLTLLHEAETGNGNHPIDIASRQLAIDTFQKYFSQSNGIILDVGCSSGFFLRDLKVAFPNVGVMGADYIAGPLKRLEEQLPGIPLLQFDLRHSPLPDACLDAISCINVLEHIDDDVAALREIYRMLKPGGIVHIEVPAVPSSYDIYDEHLMHHRRYRMSELSATCQKVGFKVLRKTHLGFFLFPAFYIIKRHNRRWLSAVEEIKSKKVRAMMNKTAHSKFMKFAMKLELLLGNLTSFPIGIRCVIILRK